MKYLLPFYLTTCLLLFNQTHVAAQNSNSKSVATVNKNGATVSSSKGGGAKANSSGAEIKNKNGAGVEAKKGEVSAKSSSGKGVEANKKGVSATGSKGGLTIDKKKLEIKSKKVNIKIGG
ncbi:MAG: hypothetical protein U0T74_12250 [Chitinophagales bacterium]